VGASLLAGSEIARQSSDPPHGIYAYTAREWDPEINLYHYRARYYDPRIGRFISEDPIRLGGDQSLYAYVMNEPAIGTDPYGLFDPRLLCYRFGICPPPPPPVPPQPPRPTPPPYRPKPPCYLLPDYTPKPKPTPTPTMESCEDKCRGASFPDSQYLECMHERCEISPFGEPPPHPPGGHEGPGMGSPDGRPPLPNSPGPGAGGWR
jgi:RHS repeat-associated protein